MLLHCCKRYGIELKDLVSFPDVAVESLSNAEEARQRLNAFLDWKTALMWVPFLPPVFRHRLDYAEYFLL
jgi:hypothetical protein